MSSVNGAAAPTPLPSETFPYQVCAAETFGHRVSFAKPIIAVIGFRVAATAWDALLSPDETIDDSCRELEFPFPT